MVKQVVLGLLLFIILVPATCKASGHQPEISIIAALKKAIDTTPPDKRIDKITQIYKDHCRRLREPIAMAVLDSVQSIAQRLDDKPLECSVFILRADYYSVNRGYNQQSIRYHQMAIDFAIANDMPVETGICLHKKGLYYFTFNRTNDACNYFLQAFDKFKEAGFGNVPDISRYISEQALFYYALKDYDTAGALLKIALAYPINQQRLRINLTTAIGLIHRSYKQFPQALSYFNRALKIAVASKDSAWIGISIGNIGSVYLMQGQYEKAIPNILFDYKVSVKFNEPVNAAIALLRLSGINLQYNQFKEAALRMDTTEILLKDTKEDVLSTRIELYHQKAILYQKTGQLQDAITYSKKYETERDSLALRDNIAAVERVKLKWETEKYRSQLDRIKTIADIGAFKRNAVIFILFLLMIIFILVFNRYRLKAKRDQELLLIRKRRVDEKLKNAAESLKIYTENLKQNNALIEKFKAEIDRFKTQSTDRAGAHHLEKLMQAHIMTDETWDDFKKLFTKVHSGFFQKLRRNYAYLTDTDIRLLALIKLDLNNREMANMLGITIEGIKKAKQRLRKKMQITPDTTLEQAVANL